MSQNIKKLLKVLLPCLIVFLSGMYIYDMQKMSELPRFRSTDHPFKTTSVTPLPTRKGLEILRISGSRRPTQGGLKKNLGSMGMPVYSFDLQQEDHYYINGSPARWYGYDSAAEAGVNMAIIGTRHYIRRLIHTGKLVHTKEDMQTEKEITEALGFKYIGILQTRHRIPKAEQVDQYMDTINSIPQPSWIHFHCNGGRSRTSLAMVMYDIMKNGREVSVEDIVKRQHLLGSEDLFDTRVWATSTYTKEMLENRAEFIKAFYRYVNDPEGYGVTKWSEWSAKHKVYTVVEL